jgi:dephospho-CoA kinase
VTGMRAPRVIGLTGNVGSGKSTVARIWSESGVPVVDADALARETVAPGMPGLAAVVDAFGAEVLSPEGTLDRGRMRARVFHDPEARARLEAILHPRIHALRQAWVHARGDEGARWVVCEIPLLFEVGMEGAVDAIVFVDAPEGEWIRRLVEGRGWSPEDATRVAASQGDPSEKRLRAHHVLENYGSPRGLEQAARALQARLEAEAEDPRPPTGFLRMDLHLHTRGSWDSRSDPEAVLERARRQGIGRIAITDHNRLGVALEMHARHPAFVIPGEEVKTAEGIDVIGLYLQEEIPKGTPMEETCRRIRAQGGIPYLPHPYAAGKGGAGRYAEQLAPQVDVVEVWNSRLLSPEANAKGLALAERQGRLHGVGSDAHTVGELGNAWVEVPWHPNTPEALLAALPHGKVHGTRAALTAFARSNLAKVLNRFDPRR